MFCGLIRIILSSGEPNMVLIPEERAAGYSLDLHPPPTLSLSNSLYLRKGPGYILDLDPPPTLSLSNSLYLYRN